MKETRLCVEGMQKYSLCHPWNYARTFEGNKLQLKRNVLKQVNYEEQKTVIENETIKMQTRQFDQFLTKQSENENGHEFVVPSPTITYDLYLYTIIYMLHIFTDFSRYLVVSVNVFSWPGSSSAERAEHRPEFRKSLGQGLVPL